MADWRLNEELYGPGGGDYVDDLGNITPDPFGSLRPPEIPVPPIEARGGFQLTPDQAAATSAAPENTELAPMFPDPAQVKAASTNASGFQTPPSGPAPATTQTQTQIVKDTTRGEETSTSGLSDEDRATALGDIETTRSARQASNEATTQLQTEEAALGQQRAAERMAAAIAENQKISDRIAAQELVLGKVDEKLRAGADWRPDRSALFRGDNGTLRGIAAAVAAMAGGWLMGQGLTGGKNPYLDAVIDMINEDVNDQVRQNSAIVQTLKEHKGDAQAAIAALKQRQLAVADQYLDAMALKDKSDLMQKGVAAAKAQLAAQDAEWEKDQKKALMRSETRKLSSSVHSRTTSTTGAAATPAAQQAKKAAQAAGIRKMDRIIATLERGAKSGAAASVLGYQSKLGGMLPGGNAWYEFFVGLPEDQREQLQNLDELKIENLGSTQREFNSRRAQDMLMNFRVPTNDRDIPGAIQQLKVRRDEMFEEYNNAAPEEPVSEERAY